MTMRTMNKRLEVVEQKVAPPVYQEVRIVDDSAESKAMIAEAEARGDDVEFIMLVGMKPDD